MDCRCRSSNAVEGQPDKLIVDIRIFAQNNNLKNVQSKRFPETIPSHPPTQDHKTYHITLSFSPIDKGKNTPYYGATSPLNLYFFSLCKHIIESPKVQPPPPHQKASATELLARAKGEREKEKKKKSHLVHLKFQLLVLHLIHPARPLHKFIQRRFLPS